jgi:uncharacterized protein (TIGR02922 family)
MVTETENKQLVTVIYYSTADLELKDKPIYCRKGQNGRVIIPESFKKDKNIVAVIGGRVKILNKIGDRILEEEIQVS